MFPLLLLLMVPFVEIALFIQIGGALGLWPTLGLVAASALAGLLVIQGQGRGASAELQRRLERGEDPAGPLAHAALLMMAGVALLLPGFFTDAVGLALLLAPVRGAVIAWGAARFAARVRVQGAAFGGGGPGRRPPTGRGDVVEGEYERVDEAEDRRDEGDADRHGTRPDARIPPPHG